MNIDGHMDDDCIFAHVCTNYFVKLNVYFHEYSWLSDVNMFEPTVCPGGQHTAANRGMQVVDGMLHKS